MIIERITEITCASKMKVIVISIFCALAGNAAGGAVAWPGAIPLSASIVKTVVPGETKINAYSTSQYINALPTSYLFGAQPQFAYQVPQVNSFAPLPTGYYSIASPSYIPSANIFYPAHASFVQGFGSVSLAGASVIPSLPSPPSSSGTPTPTNPSFPAQSSNEPMSQPAGDSDSAVIDSAEFAAQQQNNPGSDASSPKPQPAESQPSQPPFPQFPPSNTFPNFPAIPQTPQESGNAAQNIQQSFPPQAQIPQFPQIPQAQPPINFPSFPQIPQNPQEIAPSFPQLPQIPQNPGFPPNLFPQEGSQSSASFPASDNSDKGLNDEDTVSVESA